MNNAKEVLKDAWDRHEGPVVLTTVDENEMPNAIYVTFVKYLDDGRIVVADNYFNKTRSNIRRGSKGSVLFLTKERKSYQAKGGIEYLTDGPIYDDMRQWVDQKKPRIAAAVLNVDEFYSGAEKLM